MDGFAIDPEVAARVLKDMIDNLDADSLADLVSYVYDVDVWPSDDGSVLEVCPTHGNIEAFNLMKSDFVDSEMESVET